MDYPLEGMNILDFTYLLPGPYGTMMLSDLGADIIKIENLTNPDLLHITEPMVDGVSAAYAHINRGKKSFSIDLKKDGARDIIHRLLSAYDIVVEQFRPGVMEKLGLGYDALKTVAPGIIYCSLTGYGQTGSYSMRAGHDINYMALSGIESFSGRKSTGPALSGIQIADVCAGGKNLAMAVMAAYIRRLRTGRGDYVDISITDSSFALSAFQAAGFLAGGAMPDRESDFLNGGSLYDFYRTADGRYVSVGPLEPKFSAQFFKALGLEDTATSLLLSGDELTRVKKRVEEIFASMPLAHWQEVFASLDACVEPVYTLEEAVSSPPIAERAMVVDVVNDKGTPIKQAGNPIKFASGDCHARHAGVSMGYHNRKIMESLGYSGDEIDRLKAGKVIG